MGVGRVDCRSDDSRRRPRGHEPRHPHPGRPLRPRQRRLAGHRRDPRRPLLVGPVRDARRHRRGARARDHRGLRRRRGRRADEAQKIGDLFASFMDEDRVEELGHTPILPAARADRRPHRPRASWPPSSAPSSAVAAAASSARTSTPTTATPTATSSTSLQGGIGLPDESYYREEKFAEIREKYLAYLDPHPRRWPSAPTPRARPAAWSRWRPGWPRATGSGPRPATSSRPTT